MRNAMRWTALTGLLLGLALAASACSTNRSMRMLTAERFARRLPDYPIELTESDYQEPHREIAVLTTGFYREDLLDTAGRAELRRLARRVGADAVVKISRRGETSEEVAYRPGNLFRTGTRFVEKTALTGVAVRFEREEAK